MIEVIVWIFVCIFAIIFVAAVIMLLTTILDMWEEGYFDFVPFLREKETYKDSFSEDWDSEADEVYDDL